MAWLALDIGGANIKVADGRGFTVSQPFALWQKPKQLAEVLRAIVAGAPPSDHLAATMTGELADCFPTKVFGVQFILEALAKAADGRHTRVYLNDGRLVAPQIALRQPLLAAASNWHALAKFAARHCEGGNGLLIDIGSTTADIVPIVAGQPTTVGKTDTERMLAGELVYTGVERSPVCALAASVPYRGQHCPLAQEVFATALDVHLVRGDLPDEPETTHTADHRPATRAAAMERLARSICADRDFFGQADAVAAAEHLAAAQLNLIVKALNSVLKRMEQPPATVVVSGRGEFLAQRALHQVGASGRVVSLTGELGAEVSRCATAHALAVLATEGN